ncbi:hypothetical protein ABZ401_19190 [Streptomyces sp. NPDC005892]|uniref:hypothetical protein n=1 Tax=Streptomyces sp. NPDC005892 TaxID=3155593 RepID=UPI0033E5061C
MDAAGYRALAQDYASRPDRYPELTDAALRRAAVYAQLAISASISEAVKVQSPDAGGSQ